MCFNVIINLIRNLSLRILNQFVVTIRHMLTWREMEKVWWNCVSNQLFTHIHDSRCDPAKRAFNKFVLFNRRVMITSFDEYKFLTNIMAQRQTEKLISCSLLFFSCSISKSSMIFISLRRLLILILNLFARFRILSSSSLFGYSWGNILLNETR